MIASEIPQSKTGLASRGYLPTVQIVKSDPDERAELEVLLRRRGFRVRGFPDGETFLMAMAQETADIVLLDTDVPQASRQEALFRLNDLHRESFVILLSDEGALNGSSESLRLATYDILQRPFDIERLCNSIQNALRTKSLMHEVRKLKDELRAQFDFKDIIGTSAAHVQMLGTLRWLAESDGHVLLQGESGTGKKLAARTVHYNSRRADAPFLYVNCTILRQDLFEAEVFSLLQAGAGSFGKRAAGKWERANGGTLFLDGIDGMKPAFQADLLRRLKPDGKLRLSKDYPPADVRFILSAQRDLAQEAATGRFEPEIIDLLSPFCLGIPPLRERSADVPLLVKRTLIEAAREMTRSTPHVAPEAMEILKSYPWPGNVLELKNVIRQTFILTESNVIGIEDLPPSIREGVARPGDPQALVGESETRETSASLEESIPILPLRMIEDHLIQRALTHTRGNVSHAANMLGISRAKLYRRLRARKTTCPNSC